MAKSYIHQNSSFPFWVKNGLVVSRTLLRAAGWWQRQNSLSAQAHSAVNCLLCRTGWASQDQSSRAQSTSTAVTAFHPWCYHLHWPKASDPHCFHSHFIQWEHLWLLCYPPQKKKKTCFHKAPGMWSKLRSLPSSAVQKQMAHADSGWQVPSCTRGGAALSWGMGYDSSEGHQQQQSQLQETWCKGILQS